MAFSSLRVKVKVLKIIYKTLCDLAVCYLSASISHNSPLCSLHSSHTGLLTVPRSQKVSFHLRAFVLTVPLAWHFLLEICMTHFRTSFRSLARCHLSLAILYKFQPWKLSISFPLLSSSSEHLSPSLVNIFL